MSYRIENRENVKSKSEEQDWEMQYTRFLVSKCHPLPAIAWTLDLLGNDEMR